MDLYNKIIKIYPSLTQEDFSPFFGGTIALQNDGDGDYIKLWNHPTLIQPTEQQLDQIK
jgi:hypothetical protein